MNEQTQAGDIVVCIEPTRRGLWHIRDVISNWKPNHYLKVGKVKGSGISGALYLEVERVLNDSRGFDFDRFCKIDPFVAMVKQITEDENV